MDVHGFFKAVLEQDEKAIRGYFHEDAYVNWHCTNEYFCLDEYIVANCEYPGEWDGKIERVEKLENLYIVVAKVFLKDESAFFHVVSFIRTEKGKIVSMDEYWADDGCAPRWRLDKHIGTPID